MCNIYGNIHIRKHSQMQESNPNNLAYSWYSTFKCPLSKCKVSSGKSGNITQVTIFEYCA